MRCRRARRAGPFLGVFLQENGWSPSQIGLPVRGLIAGMITDAWVLVPVQVQVLDGVGAACSPALSGWIAEQFDYWAAFLALGGIAAAALALWLLATPIICAACAGEPRDEVPVTA